MSTVAEFVEVRQKIEAHVKQIDVSVERKVAPQARQKLDEATQLLTTLRTMADNDVQEIAVGRLTRELARLEKKVGSLAGKPRVSKKQPAV